MAKHLTVPKSIGRVTLIYWLLATGTIGMFELSGATVIIHTPVILLCLIYILTSKINRMRLFDGVIFFFPYFCFIMVSILQSNHYLYAWEKVEGGIISSIIMSMLVYSLLIKYGELRFFKNLFFVIILFLILTIIYRLVVGVPLNGREGRYLLNGPITYGWIMGMAALIGNIIFSQTGKYRYIGLSLVCIMFMIGTNSKGPLLAFLCTFIVFIILNYRKNRKVKFLSLLYPMLAIPTFFLVGDDATNRLQVLNYGSSNHSVEALGTYSVRAMAYMESWYMIQDNPVFGVGIGNWNDFSEVKILYPHNYFLEIASELGLLALIVFIIQLGILFIYSGSNGFIILTFFSIALLFSGDISYHRYLLGIPLGLTLYKTRIARSVD